MKLTIDGQPIDVNPGTTILEAARRLGLEIPTLCHLEGLAPRTSCFVCVVKIEGGENFHPACTTRCAEGMAVVSSSPEVAAIRKTALELLLSDHAGACVASCVMACPAGLDVPGFTAPLARDDQQSAIAVIRRRLAFPAALGYICPGFCESACVRKKMDEPIGVRALHRIAAEKDLLIGEPTLPPCRPASGKCVAIVGAGPAGLSAAFNLLQQGHDCLLFDAAPRPGGLLAAMPEQKLPRAVLDAEIALVQRLGAQFKPGWSLGASGTLEELRGDFDAVLLACGAGLAPGTDRRKVDLDLFKRLGLATTAKALAVDKLTLAASLPGVFAAGEAALGPGQLVWAVATGRQAAASIAQYLDGEKVTGEEKQIYFRAKNSDAENTLLYAGVSRLDGVLGADPRAQGANAPREACRCLQCGCAARDGCKLRRYATRYGAAHTRFRGERRELAADATHREIVYEPGKCILCGLCLAVAERAGEERGLCFVGRGFTTRVTAPLGDDLDHGLRLSARACAAACPTGALALKDGPD